MPLRLASEQTGIRSAATRVKEAILAATMAVTAIERRMDGRSAGFIERRFGCADALLSGAVAWTFIGDNPLQFSLN
jgi:hypothetical protein